MNNSPNVSFCHATPSLAATPAATCKDNPSRGERCWGLQELVGKSPRGTQTHVEVDVVS